MSTYDETCDDHEVECPYCGSKYQPEAEDYSEDEREEECGDCGKKYFLHQSFTVTHHARPDCVLNGGQHDYRPFTMRDGTSVPFCDVCGRIQPHSERAATKEQGHE